jgi:Carboxypeptidase regulatory-like domain
MKQIFFASLLLITFCVIAAAQTTGVKGKVTTVKGKGLSGVTITLIKDGVEVKQEETGENGEFLIEGLDEGIYSFWFDKEGFNRGSAKRLQILKGQIRNLGKNLVLNVSDNSLYVFLRASVFDQDGLVVRGAKVEITRVSENKKLTTLYTNDGGEVLLKLPDQDGMFRFTAYFKDSEPVSGEIKVEGTGMYHKSLTMKISKPERKPPQQP